MKQTVLQFAQKYAFILTFLAVGIIGYFVVEAVVKERLQGATEVLTTLVHEQEGHLITLAETTASGSSNPDAETLIIDCELSKRMAFDTLLGRLDSGLSTAELQELEGLFGWCGDFYAERKAFMAMKLSREVEIYTAYVDQLEILTSTKVAQEYNVETWKRLAEEEEKLSQLYSKLVTLQGDIISTLLTGKSADSDEIKTILGEVRETQDSLIVMGKQTTTIREEVTSK